MEPTYAQMLDEFNYLRGLSALYVVLLNGSAGLPTDILATTVAQLAAVEVAANPRYTIRPIYNPSASILNTTKRRHELSFNLSFVADTAAFTFDRVAIISGGSSTRGNTAGVLRFILATASSVTIPANSPGVIQVNLLSGGSLSDYTP